jgi:transcriptional regulator with XRE-family HTH domain
MSRSIPAIIQPELLVWARERSGLELDAAATRTGIEVATLREWERGEGRPSIFQLRKLGEAYKRPIAVFFLAEPPRGFRTQRN